MTKENNELQNLQDKYIKKLNIEIEQYLKLRIRDKPKYIPKFLYKWILNKLVVMEYFSWEIEFKKKYKKKFI